jgi:hypothetical protein
MTDADRKRAYVSDLYDGPKWKRRVAKMRDDQVTAIYLKHQKDGQEPKEYSELIEEPDEPEHLDIPRNGRGPHADEDKFEIY